MIKRSILTIGTVVMASLFLGACSVVKPVEVEITGETVENYTVLPTETMEQTTAVETPLEKIEKESETQTTEETETTTEETTEEETSFEIPGTLISPHFGILSNEEANVFSEIAEEYTSFEPVSLLGTQMVAGTNYMFLAHSFNDDTYKVVVAYEDFNGSVEVTDIYDFSYDNLSAEPILNSEIPGGWNVNNEYSNIALPELLQSPIDELTSDDESVIYDSLAYLGYDEEYKVLVHVIERTDEGTKNGIAIIGISGNNDDLKVTSESYINMFQ